MIIDPNFVAGFILGFIICGSLITTLVLYACAIMAARADSDRKMAGEQEISGNGMREWHDNCVIWD
jgi:hypothetical protein